MSPVVRIRGLAERAQRIGPAVTVPPVLPLLADFSYKRGSLGGVSLTRDGDGIRAEADIDMACFADGWPGRFTRDQAAAAITLIRRSWPYFCLGYALPALPASAEDTEVITEGKVVAVSLCACNRDPAIPPWEVAAGG